MPAFAVWIPIQFFLFWFIEAPKGLILYFVSLNKAVSKLLSLGLFLGTFFKPLKNEYRSGLVGFSILMGVVVKSILITADLLILLSFVAIEAVFVILFIGFPIVLIRMLFP
ncbi:MAG: hypothetical protein A3J69_02640 [Candidatus Levybacteria bacterium RIFCSPHIGHO2_02_FULL_42_12]|nr:MAG: hypothetical protein A3J69_02640 [Candidatus Levybacteria bacterium RIFCSPHIGHO2_02_FULL_42_12]OGH43089.1 MAG: hypothetical protein A3B53_03180 [Candidatus Levybacteria bacterium RIFCSPLOWO2_01_FULL_42_15]